MRGFDLKLSGLKTDLIRRFGKYIKSNNGAFQQRVATPSTLPVPVAESPVAKDTLRPRRIAKRRAASPAATEPIPEPAFSAASTSTAGRIACRNERIRPEAIGFENGSDSPIR
eukprot:TRINITY_DN9877_c0_g1_i1.p1 TRINITY_DN9877_c0_g1~~TRINITY_DN9877_c0_g1_i1.p1  ORF type:complete len:113 (-),score=8.35 TRINITY_DN9877_c0_g1_i1:237-575(-)